MLISTKPALRVSPWGTTLREHWPEYVIEAAGLELFMFCACAFGTLLGYPESPIVRVIRNPTRLRVLMGLAMGSTAAALIYSKFGKRSGAHLNPSTTLTFLRLGKSNRSMLSSMLRRNFSEQSWECMSAASP